jgi:hypothetical protein
VGAKGGLSRNDVIAPVLNARSNWENRDIIVRPQNTHTNVDVFFFLTAEIITVWSLVSPV